MKKPFAINWVVSFFYRVALLLWGPTIKSYINCQFKHFLSEYYRHSQKECLSDYIKIIIDSYKEGTVVLGWSDVCALRVAIIDKLNVSELKIEEKHLKLRFKSIADEDQYHAYEEFVNSSDATDEVSLRSQVVYLANRLYWAYALATKGHEIRSCVSVVVSIIFILLLFFMFAYSHVYAAPEKHDLLVSVACFGAFGAYISFHRRMSRLKIHSETFLSFLQLRSGYFDGVSALFSGALFALLVLILWESGVLSYILHGVFSKELLGVILPEKTPYELGCPTNIPSLFLCMSTNSSQDFAKLLAISFLAGFAEKLIPDAIDGIVDRAKPKQ